MHFQARANKLPEIHRRLVSIRTVMQHAIERMLRCNIHASVASSPINHERQRGDCAREQIDASPSSSETKHASSYERDTVHNRSETRTVREQCVGMWGLGLRSEHEENDNIKSD